MTLKLGESTGQHGMTVRRRTAYNRADRGRQHHDGHRGGHRQFLSRWHLA